MSKKNLYLVAGILTAVVFIGYLGESGPKEMFGYSVNIWIIRLAWLATTVGILGNYYQLRKAEK